MIKSTLILVLLFAGTPCTAAELGRLFFDPKERQALEDLRDRALRPSSSESDVARFEGSVRRNDGVNTVWLNGKAMRANDTQSSAAVKLSETGTLRIVIQQTGTESAKPPAQGSGRSSTIVRDKPLVVRKPPPQSAPLASTSDSGAK